MKITRLETFPVSVPYKHDEVSHRVHRGGVSDVIVKLTTDDGLIGWGESCSGADTASIEQAVRTATPFLLGKDPWQSEQIALDFFETALWDQRAMSGCFAFAGIDQALWDLCGKACGQPLYRLLGGALRKKVNYFYYLAWSSHEELEKQCYDGVERGYDCFYLKAGVDSTAEEEMLKTVRDVIGPNRKIRIDPNQAWTVTEAIRLLTRWNDVFDIDFAEAPVPIEPVDNMIELRNRVPVALCANEGTWTQSDAYRIIRSRCADVICFSSYFVGSTRRFHTLCHLAHLEGMKVCKHTHGELGITAAAGHHVMLSVPNACDGVQQTASIMQDDILTERLPIADGPNWGIIDDPGLGVEVDEDKLEHYNRLFKKEGQFLPYKV